MRFGKLCAEMHGEFGNLRAEMLGAISYSRAETMKRMIGLLLVQGGLIVGVLRLLPGD